MPNNSPAQTLLTDEEIQDIADGFDIYGAKPEFARAIESALLSKLRAEGVQAGEGWAMDEAWNMAKAAAINDYGTDTMAHRYLYRAALASAPVADRQRLRELVDVVWNEATESTAVPDTPWADRLIDKVFPSLAASAPVAGEATKPRPPMCRIAGVSEDVLQRAAARHFKPPFDNCSFRMCDLPGQCRGEGKCHHPASAPVADERAAFNKCHSTIIKALAAIAMADGPDTRREDDPELIYRSPVMDDVVRIRIALDECSAALASAPVADESPMAKMAEALREKARQEQQAYQDRRNQATEWGPMPEGTEADSPTSSAPVAHVAGDEVSRHLEWAKDRSAWEMPVGTPVYYSVLASAPVAGEAVSWQVRRTDGSPLACWESCTKELYDLTKSTGRYSGFENGPPCEVRALGVIDAAPQASEAVYPDTDIVDLAREGVQVNNPGSPEHTVCAELVRIAAALSAQPGAQRTGGGE